MDNKNNNNKSIGYILGRFLAAVVLTCIVVCTSAIVIALTLKLLTWLF